MYAGLALTLDDHYFVLNDGDGDCAVVHDSRGMNN